jgi:uncharacterized protein (TIRG00374 family)
MPSSDPKQDEPAAFPGLGSKTMRRVILIVLLVVGTYLLLPRLVGVSEPIDALRHAHPTWILFAIVLQAVAAAAIALAINEALLPFGRGVSLVYALDVTLASNFVSMFIPSAGLSGLAARARYLTDKGVCLDATLLSYIVEIAGQGMAIVVLVALAYVEFALVGETAPLWVLILLAVSVVAGLAALSVVLSESQSGDWRHALIDGVNRLLIRAGRRPLETSHLWERIDGVRCAVMELRGPRLWRVMVINLVRTAADIGSLACTFLAFGHPVALRLCTVNYGASSVLSYLSSAPGGLLVAEGSLSALFAQQGVPASVAVAAILSYRLYAFWLPRAAGLVSLIRLQRRARRPLW